MRTIGGYVTVFLNKIWPFPAAFLFIFVFSIQLTVHRLKFCPCLDLNGGPLVSEVTALPTAPQPLPNWLYLTVASEVPKQNLFIDLFF